MDENRLRFGVGVLVISAIGIGIILTFLFGAFPSVLRHEYTLSVVFPSAEGIGVDTQVVRDGVQIGRVSDIQLRPEGGVLVTLSMDSSKPLTHRYLPRIGSGNLVTGDADLEFVLGTDAKLAEVFSGKDMTLIASQYTNEEFLDYGDKTRSIFEMQADLQGTFEAIRVAGQSIAAAGKSVDDLAKEVRQVVGGTDHRVDQLADEAVKTLEEFQGAIRDVRKVVGNPKLQEGLEQTLTELPELLQNAQSVLKRTEKTFSSIERVGEQFEKVGVVAEETVKSAQDVVQQTGKVVQQTGESISQTVKKAERTIANAEKTFANLEQFTRPFAEQGDEFATSLLTTLTSLDRTLIEFEQFGKTLNQSDGTVKRLLEDDEIYYQIRRSIENVERATARIRPILDDVRIFTDKIARDPRQLGVRGALTKRPSGTGLK